MLFRILLFFHALYSYDVPVVTKNVIFIIVVRFAHFRVSVVL